MTNKNFERGGPIQFTPPSGTPITDGTLVLVGSIACVLISSAPDANFPNPSKQVAADTEGVFTLTATAKSSLSPSTNSKINPGDKLYYEGGTLDSTTNVTTGGTIDKNSAGTFIGTCWPQDSLASGTTGSIRVRLKGDA